MPLGAPDLPVGAGQICARNNVAEPALGDAAAITMS